MGLCALLAELLVTLHKKATVLVKSQVYNIHHIVACVVNAKQICLFVGIELANLHKA